MMRAYKLALRRAERHLAEVDKKLAKIITAHGRCGLVPYWDRTPFVSLVQAVAHQQLHGRAAQAILKRLVEKFAPASFPSPEDLTTVQAGDLRALGFSAAKVATIQGIAAAALGGTVPTREQAELLSDEQLIEQLTVIRGIGRWTVEMLLIFTLGRLDVMPIDDFGVKAGLQNLYKLQEFPKRPDFAVTDKWKPYRSIGAWYLWREADRLKDKLKVKA